MVKLAPLLVCGLVLCLASARLLTSDNPEKPTEPVIEGEVKSADQSETLVNDNPVGEVKQETPVETPTAETAKDKQETPSKPAEPKQPEVHPSKNKVTFFVVIGIIVLGLGAIAAAHFLKNSQFAR